MIERKKGFLAGAAERGFTIAGTIPFFTPPGSFPAAICMVAIKPYEYPQESCEGRERDPRLR
jgi:hypothetical protein